MIWALGCAVIGAAAFRIRGGWWPDHWPGQPARVLYAAIMATLCTTDYVWPAVCLAWFVGAVATGTFHAIDAGRNEGTPWRDGMANTFRGFIYVLPAAVVMFVWHFLLGHPYDALAAGLLLLGGLSQGLLYEAAWRWAPSRQTEWAELATGAAFGLAASAV